MEVDLAKSVSARTRHDNIVPRPGLIVLCWHGPEILSDMLGPMILGSNRHDSLIKEIKKNLIASQILLNNRRNPIRELTCSCKQIIIKEDYWIGSRIALILSCRTSIWKGLGWKSNEDIFNSSNIRTKES